MYNTMHLPNPSKLLSMYTQLYRSCSYNTLIEVGQIVPVEYQRNRFNSMNMYTKGTQQNLQQGSNSVRQILYAAIQFASAEHKHVLYC